MLTLEMIRDAAAALEGVARVTPLNEAKNLGKNVYIKAENLQKTGAFKLRGAYNKIRSLSEEERARVCGLIYGTISLLTAVFPSLIGQMTEVSLRLPFAVCIALFVFAASLVIPLSRLPAHQEQN